MPSILESQPKFYSGFFPAFFGTQIAEETKATCSSCAMCEASCQASVESVDGVSRLFRPETKCCTYHPTLPNFLVGAILSDESGLIDEGKKKIEQIIASRVGVTPVGILAPPVYNLLYQNSRDFFGKTPAMRCPYYSESLGGSCSIWPYRESVCSTYFCKHVAGADGRKFWMSLKSYLALTESQLIRYALYTLYPDYLLSDKHPKESRALSSEDLQGIAPAQKTYSTLWDDWAGLEVDFFKECYRLVTELKENDFEKIMGLDGVIAQATLEKLHGAAVFPRLPDRLKLNPSVTVQWLPDGSVALASYSELDGLALPGEAYMLLKEFDGSPVESVRARLRAEKQSDFADEVLLGLYHQRVLTTP